jgi:hypothetical protein
MAKYLSAPAGSLNDCCVPAAFGVGAPLRDLALAKFAAVIGESDVTTWYLVAVPHSRSAPGALKLSAPPPTAAL